MENSMDPYEQQLLSVFNSYDISHRGSLDRDGLMQLCNSLQLEEQGVELVKCLLSDSKAYVTFNEFKDGLLALLGNVQNNRQKLDFSATSDSESESPDREISPKFVYGSKKYGRRSRPESTEQIELFDHQDNDLEKNSEVFMDKYENKPLKNVNKVQRSNSQSDVTHSRKRKTNGKLKRCTSFPGNHEMERHFKNWSKEKQCKESKLQSSNTECSGNMLRSVLEQLEIGADGYLNHLELVRVCEYVGMHKLAKGILQQLSTKHDPDLNKRISIEEFLSVMQKDECLYEVISPASTLSPTSTLNSTLNTSCITDDSVLYPNNKSLQYITMGPNGSGVISSQAIIELWENAGISSAANLLQELGFSETNIGIVDLAMILDDELRNLNDSRSDISYTNINPHIVLLQASIVLYQSEVKYLKSVLEQLSAERDKLRSDIADANHRASLLAQEVDDNHAKMEKSTQNQVRLIEQRHSDMLKEVTAQFVGEKEQISLLNSTLEKKIFHLENEETKLRSDLLAIQKYNNSLEKENNSLSNQLSELEHVRTSLTEKVNLLENECQKISDMERERDQLEPLLKKLSVLQVENAELRDKNDELCTEVETLNSQVAAMRSKMSSTPTFNVSVEENVSAICEGVGLGAIKRRVDSPSKDNECSMETESPRLGKVRRCYHKHQPGEVLLDALGAHIPFNSSESGFEAELDCLDSSLSFTGSEGCSNDEVLQLQARISYLEQLLQQNSIKLPVNYSTSSKHVGDRTNENFHSKTYLIKRCKELEGILEDVQISVSKMITEKSDCKEKCDLLNPVAQLSDKLKGIVLDKDCSFDESLGSSMATTVIYVDNKPAKVDSTTETDDKFVDMKNLLDTKINENKELTGRCDDLEQALDLLRNEFENCENYWSNKLDEERQMFEQEQKQSSEKLCELLVKISEYEEQFAAHDAPDGRLSPIEEKGCLEQQFTELEEEYEDFKLKMEAHIEMKDREIAHLQQQLNAMKLNKNTCDMSVQVNVTDNEKPHQTEMKVSNLSNVIVSTNIFSSETLPHVWQYSTSSNQPGSDSLDSNVINNTNIQDRDYINPTFIWHKPDSKNSVESISSNTTENSIISIKCENTCSSLPPNISWHPPMTVPSPQPHSLNYIPDSSTFQSTPQSNTPCRPKRTRKHERGNFTSQLRSQKKEQDLSNRNLEQDGAMNGPPRWNSLGLHSNGEQTCVVPLNSIHHLHGRLRELDQHCRHLQFILKQQQRHSESVMHHCWQQHREEMNDLQLQMKSLQDKLARSDMLIKDLYLENTYLMANNQRLEHRCHMLVQCSSESTSV